MKRPLLVLTSTLACTAVLGVAISSAAPARRTIHLTATMTSFTSAVDAKPTGPSAGDLGYVGGRLYRGGKLAGRYSGVCAQLPAGIQQCTFILGLPDGQIVLAAGYGPAMNTGRSLTKRSSAAQARTKARADKATTASSATRNSSSTSTS